MFIRATRAPLTLLVAVTVALGPAVAVGAAEPAAAGPAVAFDRSMHLSGAVNARDVGGYRTEDARVVRTGVVYRTDQLSNLTGEDVAELSRRNVREVDDLRTIYERALTPDRVPPGVQVNWYDVIGAAPLPELMSTLSGGVDLYRAFVTTEGAGPAIGAVLRDVIESGDRSSAVLFHCTAGKDRAGWTAAVLLTLLGVDRETVTEDYLLSNQYRSAEDPMGGVERAWLDAAFDQAVASYGSWDGYVRDGLGLSPADVAALKSRMLV